MQRLPRVCALLVAGTLSVTTMPASRAQAPTASTGSAPSGTDAIAERSAPARGSSRADARRNQATAAKTKQDGPDAALIEYLGEFDDAADGLDAMGLAEPDADKAKTGDGGGR